MPALRFFENTPRLPSPEVVERFLASGLTRYTFEEIAAVAAEADAVNRQWAEAQRTAGKFADKAETLFSRTKEERTRHMAIINLADQYSEVRVFGAKRHSTEAYPIATAQREIKRLRTGIKKMMALAAEFERTFENL